MEWESQLKFGFEKRKSRLVLFQLKRHHGDDKEEDNPRNGCDEAHVNFVFHEAPPTGQDRPEG